MLFCIDVVCCKIENFDVILDIASSPVTLEAVAEEAWLLRVDGCNIRISLYIVIISRWYFLVQLPNKEWSASWYVLLP